MSKPIVAIIGKPNVGKSRFFNYVVGERISIVEDTPGVTRDRIYADTTWRDRTFTLIDTGGIEELKNNTNQFVYYRNLLEDYKTYEPYIKYHKEQWAIKGFARKKYEKQSSYEYCLFKRR